jgi:hypothetical protein
MALFLVQIAFPLLLPFAIYAAWITVRQRQLARLERGERPRWGDAPWIWLTAIGVLLAVAVLLLASRYGGDAPGIYVPPHLGPDGQIVPGRIEPAGQPRWR